MNLMKCKADNGFIHALTDLFYSAHLHEHSEKLSSYSVVKISSNKLTKWSFTAHSALWLCSGYLLYVFTLGKHIVYYSHSIHILYICMYTFLLSSRKSVQALPPAILWSDHRLHCGYLILHHDQKQAALTVGAWGCWYIVRFLTYSGHPT